MRFTLFLVPFVVAAACGGTILPDSDAGSDANVPSTCGTDSDCPNGYACLYPVNGGCSAAPSCLKSSSLCLSACACGGTSLVACGGATKPVAHSGSCDEPPICAPVACEVCDISAFAPTAFPKPESATGACSQSDVQAFVNACIDASATQATCTAWQQSDAGASCGACILTMTTSASAGPFVCDSQNCAQNVGGCVDIVGGEVALEKSSGGSGSCGDLQNGASQCVAYACSGCTSQSDIDTCDQNAPQNECKAFEDAVATSSLCTSVDAGSASVCFPQDDPGWVRFIDVFCGQ